MSRLKSYYAERPYWVSARYRGATDAKPARNLRRAQLLLDAKALDFDPYVLDFLGLRDRYLEKDLEDAILRELENFLLELGLASALSPAKSGCKLTTMIITSTCCSTSAACGAWSPSN